MKMYNSTFAILAALVFSGAALATPLCDGLKGTDEYEDCEEAVYQRNRTLELMGDEYVETAIAICDLALEIEQLQAAEGAEE